MNQTEALKLAGPFVKEAKLSNVAFVAQGLENIVLRAESQTHGEVALRIAKRKIYANANDPNVDARQLVKQELAIYKFLWNTSVFVPRPFKYVETSDGHPGMICEYIEGEDASVTATELGRVLRELHSIPLPPTFPSRLVAHEGKDVFDTLSKRIQRRFARLLQEAPSLGLQMPAPTFVDKTAAKLRNRRLPSCLLHMDFRDVNLIQRLDLTAAVIDWSNALVGPAVIEVYRVLELERPGPEFLHAYTLDRPLPDLSDEEELFLRLDAALMIALVFLSEAPDPGRCALAVKRVRDILWALQAESVERKPSLLNDGMDRKVETVK